MKIKLEFDESHDYFILNKTQMHINGPNAFLAIEDFFNELRSIYQYSKNEHHVKMANTLQEKLSNIIEHHRVNLDLVY